jgi:UDP-glucuronate 4-epimerase
LIKGDLVVGVDNLNDYYNVRLKNWRLEQLKAHPNAENFSFARLDIEDQAKLGDLFQAHGHI